MSTIETEIRQRKLEPIIVRTRESAPSLEELLRKLLASQDKASST